MPTTPGPRHTTVRHMELCRFRDEVTPECRRAFFEQIRRLAELPGIAFSNFHSGLNASPEGLAAAFDDGFMMDFASWDACFAYLAHPTRQAISARLIEALQGGRAGLLVFDMNLEPHEKPARNTRALLNQHRDARSSGAADSRN
ncbi:Dabb family protein [Paraburkholderia unamae]|uniref:Stress responsive alpha/beta barrel protein n=1 Tax=Paraburkholderia unamae TaxID=219649 RepID=A0ABX5KJY5_9BURK|nr:Dabb family protein [Paraburkholderia unamae]PVX79819.1 stress responsive alpha/beta barrel protein [Paraburkholderia unamae]RAR54989.1 stress responsive alpha/beta barrel protein [Paraburkholderia unamae]CAG9271444.1 Stress responsive A/B Barrel Domain protein [Paraburkholderia unamae]